MLAVLEDRTLVSEFATLVAFAREAEPTDTVEEAEFEVALEYLVLAYMLLDAPETGLGGVQLTFWSISVNQNFEDYMFSRT